MRAEVHDLLLVDAEQPVDPAGKQHHQMHERAEGAVAHQHVADAQQRVQHPDLGLLVGVQGEPQGAAHQPAEGVEQAQDLGHRKAAALLAPLGLAEGLLRVGRVGGDGAGAVHQIRPQPAPQLVGGRAGREHRRRRLLQQRLEDLQRQPHAGLAVGRGRDRGLGQVPQVGHGGVEAQHLEEEQVDGADRPQLPLPPPVPGRPAGGQDGFVGEEGPQVLLDSLQRA